MAVGLLLVSHQGIASQLLKNAENMLRTSPLATRILEVPFDAPLEQVQQQAQDYVKNLDQGDGVLILTDLYGSTPCNIGKSLVVDSGFKLVSGLNLPMLIRVLNYPQLDLDGMASKAVSGGKDGVMLCE